DGMVFPPVAFPASIAIPDQRALIHFTNGTERLVIETRFTAEGTNFAWVVPLPGQPVVEKGTTGLFPTLQKLFQPRIIHNVPRYYLGALGVFGFILLIRMNPTIRGLAILTVVVLFGVATLFLPTLSRTKGAVDSVSSESDSIIDRRLVGIYETTTLRAEEPQALQTWLRENGFVISTNAAPVIASYVKDGWVFVAAKVR